MVTTSAKSAKSNIDLCWNFFLLLALGVGASLLPDAAFAQNAIQQGMCNVVVLLTSTTGKAIATIAVIAIGIGALLGKIAWGTALIVGVGIMLIFGAASIVDAVSGGAATGSCSSGAIATS